jgi:hypothetical protein
MWYIPFQSMHVSRSALALQRTSLTLKGELITKANKHPSCRVHTDTFKPGRLKLPTTSDYVS